MAACAACAGTHFGPFFRAEVSAVRQGTLLRTGFSYPAWEDRIDRVPDHKR